MEYKIKKMEMKLKTYEYIDFHPESALSKVMRLGEAMGIKHHRNLVNSYPLQMLPRNS